MSKLHRLALRDSRNEILNVLLINTWFYQMGNKICVWSKEFQIQFLLHKNFCWHITEIKYSSCVFWATKNIRFYWVMIAELDRIFFHFYSIWNGVEVRIWQMNFQFSQRHGYLSHILLLLKISNFQVFLQDRCQVKDLARPGGPRPECF